VACGLALKGPRAWRGQGGGRKGDGPRFPGARQLVRNPFPPGDESNPLRRMFGSGLKSYDDLIPWGRCPSLSDSLRDGGSVMMTNHTTSTAARRCDGNPGLRMERWSPPGDL
jgi:hypothetical protein